MKQEMTFLNENYNNLNSRTLNQEELMKSYELAMSKVADIQIKTGAFETKVSEIEDNVAEIMSSKSNITTAEESKTVILEKKLNKLEQKVKSIIPFEDQTIIKPLAEQISNVELALVTHKKDMKDILAKLNDHITEATASDETNGQNLKKEVQKLAHEMKYANNAVGKLQTITNEHYRTLLSTAQKTNEHAEHIVELAGIVDDITSYHLHLVSPPKNTASVNSSDTNAAAETANSTVTPSEEPVHKKKLMLTK